jgi:hypothetical protein
MKAKNKTELEKTLCRGYKVMLIIFLLLAFLILLTIIKN